MQRLSLLIYIKFYSFKGCCMLESQLLIYGADANG